MEETNIYRKEYGVKIFNHTWKMYVVSTEHETGSGSAASGVTNDRNKEITISASCHKDYFIKVFWHEICHAFMYELGHFPEEHWETEYICEMMGVITPHMRELYNVLDIIFIDAYPPPRDCGCIMEYVNDTEKLLKDRTNNYKG